MDTVRLDRKAAIVAGASRGMGREIAIATPIPSWHEKIDALPHRFGNAAMKAATLVQRVRLSSDILKDESDVKTWIEDTEQELLATLKKGPVVVG